MTPSSRLLEQRNLVIGRTGRTIVAWLCRHALAWMRRSLIAAMLPLACHAVHSAEPTPSLDQYQRTSWGPKDGAPSGSWSIAQTTDGWLWFGGQSGLFRFDGIRFTRMALEPAGSTRSEHVSALFATDTGALLIGRYNGGISVFEDGRFRHYPDVLKKAATVLAFSVDADGVPWAGTRSGMLRFGGTSWQLAAGEWGLPEVRFEALLLDRAGTLWVSTPTAVMRLPRGERRFRPADMPVAEFGELIESPDGRAWLADLDGVRVLPDQKAGGRYNAMAHSRASNATLFSHDGRLWSTTNGVDGPNKPVIGIPGIELLPGRPNTMLEDREGNIWLGTGANLIHRLHRKIMTTLPPTGNAPRGLGIGTAVGDDGTVWMASNSAGPSVSRSPNDGLFRFDGHLFQRSVDPPSATAIKRAADGAIWVAGGNGLWRHSGSGFAQVVGLPNQSSVSLVRGFAVEPEGDPWVSLLGVGLYRHVDGQWQRNGGLTSLLAFEPTVLDHDAAGRLWLGYRDGSVMTVDRDRVHVTGTAEQTRVGAVTALGLGRHVLVGGDRGLSLLRDGRFVALKAKGGFGFGLVTGIVQTAGGDLWINCTPGAVRIASGQLDGTVVQDALEVSAEVFDNVDGYPDTGTSTSVSLPSMTLAPDGRIWLAGTSGIAWLDPRTVGSKFKRPRAFVESVAADGHVTDAANPLRLAKGTRDVRFDYTAFAYSHPDRLQFRYRLSGYETDWVEAGPRRQAFYTNLRPARYRFEVQAANETGLWSEGSGSVEVEIDPTFMQTGLFLALCAAAVALLLAGLYRVRVGQITARERARVRERTSERERIARELHDTLLQSTQGLMLKFQTHAHEMAPDHPARADLEQTLRNANEVMLEGRDRVQDLRVAAESDQDLSESIAAVGAQLATGTATSFSASTEGRVRAVRRVVRDETYLITREALLNAFRHARASSIEVQIVYEEERLRVLVRDDGLGIDPETLGARGTPRHWGLKGMEERARDIGATFDVWSRPGSGTEIELNVPASSAYTRNSGRFAWLRRQRERS